ncbi:MAG TPA: hypothetical protein VMO76_10075 [Candidatus Udaeobacter sp.]|nr:hypothetical protein [Candidatus Udaeobacter sp.]
MVEQSPGCQQALGGQQSLGVFLGDDQEFQGRLLRLACPLLPTPDGVGAYVEVLREHGWLAWSFRRISFPAAGACRLAWMAGGGRVW